MYNKIKQFQVESLDKTSLIINGDLKSAYATSHFINIADLLQLAWKYPAGITVTGFKVYCSTGTPTTQLKAKLKYCNQFAGSAIPGTSPTDIATLDTTAGQSSATGLTVNVPAEKVVYLEMTDDPTDSETNWYIIINANIN